MNTTWVPQVVVVIIPLITALVAYLTARARLRAARDATNKARPSLNGYAPVFSDLLDRLEEYRRAYEALRVENATLKERVDAYARRSSRSSKTHQTPPAPPPPPHEKKRRTRTHTHPPD